MNFQTAGTRFQSGKNILLLKQIENQLKLMMSSTNLGNDRKGTMFISVNALDIGIQIIKMPPDGNCLFSAIYQQLNRVSYHLPGFSDNVQALRERVVSFLLARLKEEKKEQAKIYTNFLKNTIVDNKINQSFDDISYKYCKRFLKKELIEPDVWGGTESIKAICEIFNVNVLVLIEEAKQHRLFSDAKWKQTIILAYRKSPNRQSKLKYFHYDSVVDIYTHVGELVQQLTEPPALIKVSDDGLSNVSSCK